MLTYERRPGDEVLVMRQREAGYRRAMRAAGLRQKIRVIACARDRSVRAKQMREMPARSDRLECRVRS
jgi:DNA-binding LacI/PurR family transcriptional regulator